VSFVILQWPCIGGDELQSGAGRKPVLSFAWNRWALAPDLTNFANRLPVASGRGGFAAAPSCGCLLPLVGWVALCQATRWLRCATGGDRGFEEESLSAAALTGRVDHGRVARYCCAGQGIGDVRGAWRDGWPASCLPPRSACAELAAKVVRLARDKGLILLSCGQYGNRDPDLWCRCRPVIESFRRVWFSSLPVSPAGRLTRPAVRLTGA